jgi:hypothetical protein
VLIISPMYFMVSFDIVSNALNPQHIGAPYCLNFKKLMSNLMPLMFPHAFSTLQHDRRLLFCHLVNHFFFFNHFVILALLFGCVFLLLTRLRSFPNWFLQGFSNLFGTNGAQINTHKWIRLTDQYLIDRQKDQRHKLILSKCHPSSKP